jgi:cell wall assembly regulator SMI1
MDSLDRIERLYHEISGWYQQQLLPGASIDDTIAAFERRNLIRVPPDPELREWLCSGPGIVETDATCQDHPVWRQIGYLPLARDCFGNRYVLDTSRTIDPGPGRPLSTATHPVYCFAEDADDDVPTYVVSSSFERFLHFMSQDREIEQAGGERYWPFDRQRVLDEDPALSCYRGPAPLPWEVD